MQLRTEFRGDQLGNPSLHWIRALYEEVRRYHAQLSLRIRRDPLIQARAQGCGVKKLDRERKPDRLLGSVALVPSGVPILIDEKRPEGTIEKACGCRKPDLER